MTNSIVQQIQQALPAQQTIILTDYIRQWLAEFLEMDSMEEVAQDQNFAELGTSSAEAVSFKILLESKLNCSLRTTLLFDYPSLDVLTAYLLHDVLKLTAQNPVEVETPPITVEENNVGIDTDEVAVIAMEGIFPEAMHAGDFWNRIQHNAVLSFKEKSLSYGKIDDAELRIANLFSLPSNELAALDRATRTMLALLEKAMEVYHLKKQDFIATDTGVFIGAGNSNQNNSGLAYDVPLANRFSWYLNLKGPSETINTFCTSVYVALHRAAQSIRNEESTQAIVGGINLISKEEFSKAEKDGLYNDLLSSSNCTRSFCEDASGFVRSEGAGIVVLKSLRKAEQDGNKILAVIKGSAVHHGGRGYSIEAPNVKGMRTAIHKCLEQASIASDTIDYIEAHGIGNHMADAMELSAINDAYQSLSMLPDKKWHISSVKPTTGHPELAAGMASLIKVLKAFEHQTIPGLSGLGEINKELTPDNALILQQALTGWVKEQGLRRAALNSYAIGGVNAHIVLEEYQRNADKENHSREQTLSDKKKQTNAIAENSSVLSKETAGLIDGLLQELFHVPLNEIDPQLSPVHYGFDSIKVIQLVRSLNEQLNITIRLGQVMTLENFQAFFELIEKTKQLAEPLAIGKYKEHSLQRQYSLSEVQKGLWFIQESRPDASGFNVPLLFKVENAVEPVYIKQALKGLLQEFPVLRANFLKMPESEEIYQIINELPEDIEVTEHVLDTKHYIYPFAFSLLRQPFHLAKDLLLRAHTIKDTNTGQHYIFLIIHHIVIDGLSGIRFVNLFREKYKQLSQGNTPVAQGEELLFFDFLQWERAYLQREEADQDLHWWKEQLQNLPTTIPLPYDYKPDAGIAGGAVGNEKLNVDKETFEGLKKLSASMNVNLSVLLLSLFKIFLYKITGEEIIAVTTPVAGRPLKEHETAIGCFINLIITKAQVNGDKHFNTLTDEVKRAFAGGLDHSDYPFPKIVSALGLNTNPAALPLPVSFTYQNIFDELMSGSNMPELLYDVYQETEDYYTLEVYDRRDTLELNLKYKKALFNQATIQLHLSWIANLMAAIIQQENKPVRAYSLLSDAAQKKWLQNTQPETIEFTDLPIHEQIVQQCLKTPDAIALSCSGNKITYKELEEKSRRIAAALQQKGIQPDTIGAVCMPRSVEAIIAVVGILRSGAAYLPVEASASEERIQLLLDDSKAKFIIRETSDSTYERAEALSYHTLLNAASTEQKLSVTVKPQHLAYVIYTSGSTGKPKGVMIEHRSLTSLACGMKQLYSIGEKDSILQFASLSFDMSVEELFPGLISGATIVIRQEEDTEAARFYQLVKTHNITILNLPPQYYSIIDSLPESEKHHLFSSVRLIAFGGEQLSETVLKSAQQHPIQLFNAYGPTECTVNAAVAELTHAQEVHIGKAFFNNSLYVLNKEMQVQPQGLEGELYIGGTGVARGYLNRPELTAEKFIKNPFGEGRLYKTGDKARWNIHGTLEYLGRLDEQVKVRGFRVEPEEIEIQLQHCPGILQAAVTAVNSGNANILVAFYVAEKNIEQDDIKSYIGRRLPDYMIPSVFIALTELPLTANGKTDRNALRIKSSAYTVLQPYAAPASMLEEQVLEIWKEVLNAKGMGVTDNFYELGGHSLLALQIQSRMQKATKISVPLNEFFKAGTVRVLVEWMHVHKEEKNAHDLAHYEEGNDELLF